MESVFRMVLFQQLELVISPFILRYYMKVLRALFQLKVRPEMRKGNMGFFGELVFHLPLNYFVCWMSSYSLIPSMLPFPPRSFMVLPW